MGHFFSKPSPDPLMETGWCEINWDHDNEVNLKKLKENLKKIKNPSVEHLHILVTGPVGAGKSRLIQSIASIVQRKMTNAARTVETIAGKSFTKEYTTCRFKDGNGRPLPFVITDVMGLESGKDGVQPEDIISALKGHIKEGYTFNSSKPCSEEDREYNRNPTLNDKVHCLVFVIPAGSFIAVYNKKSDQNTDVLDESLVQKMTYIRRKACDLKIPQVVILTKVDLVCKDVRTDFKLIYRSKLIYRKARACSNALGIPMSDIFLVRNYDEEKQLKPDVDAVQLFTLQTILDFAKEYVEMMREPEAARDHMSCLNDLAVGDSANNRVGK